MVPRALKDLFEAVGRASFLGAVASDEIADPETSFLGVAPALGGEPNPGIREDGAGAHVNVALALAVANEDDAARTEAEHLKR